MGDPGLGDLRGLLARDGQARAALGLGEDGCVAKRLLSAKQLLAALQSGSRDADASVVLRATTEVARALAQLPEGLRVRGVIVVAEVSKEAWLPLALGRIVDKVCGVSLTLPPRLVVDGDIIVRRSSLKALSFGEGLHVGGTLDLHDDEEVTVNLPNGLHVGGDLKLPVGRGLTRLPDGLHVSGDLDASSCLGLTSLPADLRVEGTLSILGFAGSSLPEGLVLGGDLLVSESASLTSLPASIRVGGNLYARHCSALTSWPGSPTGAGPIVHGGLSLQHCSALTDLPSGLQVGGNCSLEDCSALTALPPDFRVGGDLDLSGCEALASLPEGLRVGGDLHSAHGRRALTSLPRDMRVGGTLDLRGCDALTCLPEGLRHPGDLILSNCDALACLPEDFYVGGDLYLDRCESLRRLPACMLAWPVREDNGEPHDVYLGGTGLSPGALERLREAEAPGLRFHVRRRTYQHRDTDGEDEDEGGERFDSVTEAVAFWAREAGLAPYEEGGEAGTRFARAGRSARAREDLTLVQFLSRLRDAKEFGDPGPRKGLAARVIAVLEVLARSDDDVRSALLLRMEDSLDACGDKPVWALNQMTLTVEVAKARGNRRKLEALGRRVMRLMVVHEHAKRKIDSLSWVDDVCVYLRFEIDLREALDLPVDATAMIFPSYIRVEDADLQAAKQDALAITEDQFRAWLAEWPEWQRQTRLEVVSTLTWESLPVAKPRRSLQKRLSRRLSQLVNVTGDKMVDPVTLNGAAIWSLSDLLKHWERTGLDLHNSVVSPAELKANLRRTV